MAFSHHQKVKCRPKLRHPLKVGDVTHAWIDKLWLQDPNIADKLLGKLWNRGLDALGIDGFFGSFELCFMKW